MRVKYYKLWAMQSTEKEIIAFWFEEIDQSYWFKKDKNFDELVYDRFIEIYKRVFSGNTVQWRTTPEGKLAEIIVLDQFSRNMFRDRPEAFAADALALQLAQEAVQSGDDQKLALQKKSFIYMPYMHSEDLKIHNEAVKLFSQKGLERALDFEIRHKKIIEQFGRYPHRNKILGRISTAEEIEFLTKDGSGF